MPANCNQGRRGLIQVLMSSAVGSLRGEIDLLESVRRGTVEDLSFDVEARAVAGAIPRLLRSIELDDALQVRADWREGVEPACLVAMDGDPTLHAGRMEDPAVSVLERLQVARGGRDPIADEMHRERGVLLHVRRRRRDGQIG